ncbi:MAG: right-handed parallel beta-helix repeat-containing protein, partial [bacterium]
MGIRLLSITIVFGVLSVVILGGFVFVPTPLMANVWEVTADSLGWMAQVDSLNSVAPGDTIMFVTDGGIYYSPTDIQLLPSDTSLSAVPLVLMAAPGLSEKPLLVTAFSQSRIMKIHASVTFKGLRFKGDGILEGTPYGVRFAADGNNFGTVRFEDCEFSNFRLRGIHLDKNNYTDSLIVNNCIFREIGESGMRGKEPTRDIEYAKITNNTFYKIGENAIYLRNVGDLEVSHNTFFFSDSTISGRHGG